MDKKDIDLESLRGFTPGPWHWVNGDTDEPYDLKAQWDGFGRPSLRTVRETTPPFAIYTLPEFILDAEPFDPRDEANARLIAAAPSMHAELLARRARDAEVEALVAAAHRAEVSFNTVRGCYERNPGNFMLAMNELEADVLPLRAALAAFTGATP